MKEVRRARWMTAQKKPHTLDPFQLISVLRFLKNFKYVCDSKGLCYCAVTWTVHTFMSKFAPTVINAWLGANPIKRKWSGFRLVKSRDLTTYPQVVIFLQGKYAANRIIAEMKSAIFWLAQAIKMNPSMYTAELVAKTLHCGDMYAKKTLTRSQFQNKIHTNDKACVSTEAQETRTLHTTSHSIATSLSRLQGKDMSSQWTLSTTVGQVMAKGSPM